MRAIALMSFSACVALCAGTLWAVPVSAQESELAPLGLWRLSEQQAGCTITRDFGTEEQRVTLALSRLHPSGDVQFGLFGSGLASQNGVVAGFGPPRRAAEFKRLAPAQIGDRAGFVYSGALVSDKAGNGEEGSSANITYYRVGEIGGDILRLATGPIDKAVAALDKCATSQLSRLGVNLAARSGFSRHPAPDGIEHWGRRLQNAYPVSALRHSYRGPVPARLIIAPDGKVAHCDVTDQLTAKVLRETACAGLLEHGRYHPALDADGKPTSDFVFMTVDYGIRTGRSDIPINAHGARIDE